MFVRAMYMTISLSLLGGVLIDTQAATAMPSLPVAKSTVDGVSQQANIDKVYCRWGRCYYRTYRRYYYPRYYGYRRHYRYYW